MGLLGSIIKVSSLLDQIRTAWLASSDTRIFSRILFVFFFHFFLV